MDTPLITVQTVSEALRAIRFAKPLGYGHPIAQLFQLRAKAYLAPYVDADVYADLRVMRLMTRFLRSQMNKHRHLHRLPPVVPRAPLIEVIDNVTEDFQQCDSVLESWSVLYCQYGRPDLDVTIEKLSQLTNIPERTFQRRQKSGIERFTKFLLAYELHTRLEYGLIDMREGEN